MKTLKGSYKSLLVSLLAALTVISCKDTTPTIPELTGEIKLSSSRIGAGQLVSATYNLPLTAPEHVLHTQYLWFTPESELGLEAQVDVNNKVSISFIAPKTVGDNQIKFVATHTPKDGGEIIQEKVKEFTVVPCDVATSFWNDSKEEVIRTTKAEFDDNGEGLSCEFKSENENVQQIAMRYYSFSNNKLNSVIDTEIIDSPNKNLVAVFLIALSSKTKELNVTPKELYTVNIGTEVKTNYKKEDLESNSQLMARITQDIIDKKVFILANFETIQTKHLLCVQVRTHSDGLDEYCLLHGYTPQ